MGTSQRGKRSDLVKLMIFFGLVYAVEGSGQTDSLIYQPLSYFLHIGQNWTTDQISDLTKVTLELPWILKITYGILSDFIPLFGYRRKTYLFLFNLIAVLAFLCTAFLTNTTLVSIALFITAIGMAGSSTVCGALMVEQGQKTGKMNTFINLEWCWFFIATLVSAYVGGYLCQHFSPTGAFHIAAFIDAVIPIFVMVGALFLIHEEPAGEINKSKLKESWLGLKEAVKSIQLWKVAFFLFCFSFAPAFGAPIYVYLTDSLHYEQGFIGDLSALGAAGSVVASLMYLWIKNKMSLKNLLYLSIGIGVLSRGSFVFLNENKILASILYLSFGIASMIALVSTLTLAAKHCPKKAEGFSYAFLLSIYNASGILGNKVGSWLFDNKFDHSFWPLVVITSVCTALTFFIIPFLHLGNMRADDDPND